MATNEDKLNEGPPAFDPNADPSTLPTQETADWGVAFNALLGVKGDAENQLGSALMRKVVTLTGVSVTASSVTLGTPGAVIAVEASAGQGTGAKLITVVSAPGAGEARVTYDGEFKPTITFDGGDAVTEAALVQIQIPLEFIQALQATNPP